MNGNRIARWSHPAGVTLTEVLISVGILGVGLLGVAAVFPVGSYYTQKGDIAERGAAIAQAAFADFVASGKANPDVWMVWTPGGNYGPLGVPVRNWLVDPAVDAAGMNPAAARSTYNQNFGSAYVIDPTGTAGGIARGLDLNQLSHAPYGNPAGNNFAFGPLWTPFEESWPVRRLTVRNRTRQDGVMDTTAARQQFTSTDDIDVSQLDGDRPARGKFEGIDSTGDGIVDVPLRRQERGNYSWIVSIAPSNADALMALATDPSAFYYDVSVVVFYKRAIDAIETDEKLMPAQVLATGTGGGELLLNPDGINFDNTRYYQELKQGQWVMVSGPHPNSTPAQPMLFTQWYRVLAINDKPELPITDEVNQRLIGLRGPDWPWDADARVSVGLFPGAVAVHTKTMRLDNRGVWQH